MSRFDVMLESIFAPASPEEAEERRKKYAEVCLKEWMEEFLRRKDVRRNFDGSYDVEGPVFLDDMGLERLPVRFGKVGGDFWCHDNRLTSLEGVPKEVGGDFWCYDNRLTSLVGSPKKVGENFLCHYNRLTSLEGAPMKVGGDFWCHVNPGNFTKEDVSKVCEVGGNIYV